MFNPKPGRPGSICCSVPLLATVPDIYRHWRLAFCHCHWATLYYQSRQICGGRGGDISHVVCWHSLLVFVGFSWQFWELHVPSGNSSSHWDLLPAFDPLTILSFKCALLSLQVPVVIVIQWGLTTKCLLERLELRNRDDLKWKRKRNF